jgi:phage shock protein PspC (stress-responsive transcriptional regulator)
MSNTSRELSGQKFKLSSAADELLQAYLKTIHAHFAKYPDGEEIYTDLQQRIAEKLSQDKGKQIEIADVQQLISEMGEVSDFTAELTETQGAEVNYVGQIVNRFKFTRLKRDVDNQKIAGVCAGIANYLDIDPVIIRIAFCLSLFVLVMIRSPFLWIPIAAYLALWLSMPEAKSAVEKLEMKGKPITLAEVEQEMEQKVNRLIEEEIAKEMSALERVVSLPVQVTNQSLRLGVSAVQTLFPWTVRSIGLSILLVCIGTFIAISTIASILIIGGNSPVIGIPLTLFAEQSVITALTGLAYLTIAIPTFAVLILGVSLLRMRNSFRAVPVLVGLGFWIFAVTGFGVLSLANIGEIQQRIRENPGVITPVTTTYNLDAFTQIQVEGQVRVQIEYADMQEIKVNALSRDAANLKLSSVNGVLKVAYTDPQDFRVCIFCVRHLPFITVYVPQLTHLNVTNNASAVITQFQVPELTVTMSLRSGFDYDGKLAKLNLNMSDNSTASLNGTVEDFDVNMSGHSYLYANQFEARRLNILIGGTSYAQVSAIESIDGSAEDDAYVAYDSDGEVNIQAEDRAIVNNYLQHLYGHNSQYMQVTYYLNSGRSLKQLEKLVGEPRFKSVTEAGDSGVYEYELEDGVYVLQVHWNQDEIESASIRDSLGHEYSRFD